MKIDTLADLFERGLIIASDDFRIETLPDKRQRVHLRNVPRAAAPTPTLTGACCHENGSCEVLSEADCVAAGGIYQGDDTACDPNPCPAPCSLIGITLTYSVTTETVGVLCPEYPSLQLSGTFPAADPVSGEIGTDLFEILTAISTFEISNCPDEGAFTTNGVGSVELECALESEVFNAFFRVSTGHPELNCGECGTPSPFNYLVQIPFSEIHGTHEVEYHNTAAGLVHNWVLTIE
jgi:hypothetical protein